ncbi:MAG: methylated-DNA--[protein]-cysteine S-methyltransferase [Actinomycetota bacterium]|nr:methylated-DNA--[protein]-cysteine S-methyltransferase [Actinomycetota bacterium]
MPLTVASDGCALTGVRFGPASDHDDWLGRAERRPDDPVVAAAAGQLREYAAGRAETFDLAVNLDAGSAFQRAVWAALRDIPYGRTTTYGAVAAAIGRPGQARAVGAAVGANPVGIVVPCHRVVGANGSLTGFGGGLANKAALLSREGITAI